MSSNFKYLLGLLLFFNLFSLSFLISQDFRATITGQVTDPSGSAIPGAQVRITNTATNASKQAVTNAEGNFTLPYLDPGDYTLEVTANGFQSTRRTHVALRVAQTLRLPIALQLGNSSETVTVTAQPDQVDAATADRGLAFDPVKTQQYPLNGRQEYQLMTLTPGVIFTQTQFGASGFSGNRGWDVNNSYKINGGRPGTSIFLLNGAPISDNGGTWQLSPNIEAVQEFKVMTNVYDAQYGRMAGGVVNTTLKSGSNAWHGDVFDYWRNSILDANTIQNNAAGASRGKHNLHQFGGVIGGSIRKDKDFIFASFEGWREVVPFPVVSDTVPAALRDGQGFGALGYNIYDPMTTQPCAVGAAICQGSAYIRQPFPNNQIPLSRISPIGQAILSYYPQPNSGGPNALSQNFTSAENSGRYQYNQPIIRWDHNFGDSDKFYSLFTFQHGSEFRNGNGFPAPAGTGDIHSQRTDQNYIADWTHVFSPTVVLDIRGSYGRFTSYFPRYTDTDLTADQLGITQRFNAPGAPKNTVPSVVLTQYSNIFGPNGGDQVAWSSYNQYNFSPSLTITAGKHTIHTGFEWNYVANPSYNSGSYYGQFGFAQATTQQLTGKNQGQTDGNSVASLLLGYLDSGNTWVDNNAAFYRSRPYYAVYVQDNWRLAPRFTLNWGVRYDVQVPWKERYNQLNSGFDFNSVNPYSDRIISRWNDLRNDYLAAHPDDPYGYPAAPAQILGGLQFAGTGGRPERAYRTDWTNIQPRAGFAWQVASDTVLRGGGGIYYQSPTQANTTLGYQQRTPYIGTLNGVTPSAGTDFAGPYSLNNPFPGGIAPIPGSSLGLATNIGNTVSFDNYNYRVPRTFEYSFGIQQRLFGMIADIAYTGNYTVYVPTSLNLGYLPMDVYAQGTANPTYLDRQIPNPFYGILPANSGLGGSQNIRAGALLNNYPQFNGAVTQNLDQWGEYRYDALSVQLEKRLNTTSSGNFTWVLSYAFSKAMQADHRLNNFNPAEGLVYEVDDQDHPHTLAFSGVWDLPLGKGKRFFSTESGFLNAIASNWTFDWIFTYSSGAPVGMPNLNFNYGAPGCDSWNSPHQNAQQWFNSNKSCYSNLAPYQLRTTPDRFATIRAPNQPQVNLAFEKSFPFADHYKVTVRGEAFNVANTVIYGPPITDFSNPRFGQLPLQQYNFPRNIQLAAKFYF